MWEQIRRNQRKSVMLILLMGLILAGIGYSAGEAITPGAGLIGLAGAGMVYFFQLLAYAWASESIVLSGLGAREMAREESPRLFNVVEEMSLASGLGFTPRVYLIDESAPNAFAFGRKPKDYGVAVTTGLMHRLSRDELQGVIAHEVGHLKNRDVQFMTLAAVMIGSIVLVSEVAARVIRVGGGRGSSRSSSRGNSGSSGGGQAQLVFLLIALFLIILGPIMARVLYFSISRQREYLADASAAQFTRYPEGLASALMKIARAGKMLPMVSKITAPMFIVNPLAADGETSSLMSTHPPLSKRVTILRAMAGASFLDYERAYEAAMGGKKIIGQKTLAAAEPTPARPASTDEPLLNKETAKATAHRMYGYVTTECECGASIRVPETFEQDQVTCIRCGRRNEIPSVQERREAVKERLMKPYSLMAGGAGVAIGAALATAEPMHYQRTQPGKWETFRCSCGGTVQLSPQFAAPKTACPRCRRQILVG